MVTFGAKAQVPSRIMDSSPPPAENPPVQSQAADKSGSWFIVNDNVTGYYYLPTATNPGAGKTPKHVSFFTHFDVWSHGTNYLQIEFLKSTNGRNPLFGTPQKPCDQGGAAFPPGASQCDGYSEVYGMWRGTLGWNQLFSTKAFALGPMTNIQFALGADFNWDNTTLASRKRSVQAGLQFDFAMPYKGFVNVGVYVYKEWQNDGFASTFPFQPIPNPSGDVDFNATWAIEANYVQPLGSWPIKYKALLVVHGPKGCGETCQPMGPGLRRTTEYMIQQLLVLDVGRAFWDRPDRLAVFGGFRWWHNKFGIDSNQPNGRVAGTDESTWLVGAAMKF